MVELIVSYVSSPSPADSGVSAPATAATEKLHPKSASTSRLLQNVLSFTTRDASIACVAIVEVRDYPIAANMHRGSAGHCYLEARVAMRPKRDLERDLTEVGADRRRDLTEVGADRRERFEP